MRIAVAGSHGSGKTTLIEDFLAAHRDYAHEPEPYEWLAEEQLAVPEIADFYRQLEVCVERLRGHAPGARMIAERSPLDFLAYILACDDLHRGRASADLLQSANELAARGMKHVDLLVVLPLTGDAEDPELREAMDERLVELAGSEECWLIELHGSRAQRLAALEEAVSSGLRQR